jgi:hypothetical protein
MMCVDIRLNGYNQNIFNYIITLHVYQLWSCGTNLAEPGSLLKNCVHEIFTLNVMNLMRDRVFN